MGNKASVKTDLFLTVLGERFTEGLCVTINFCISFEFGCQFSGLDRVNFRLSLH